jgi:hypothetical protein
MRCPATKVGQIIDGFLDHMKKGKQMDKFENYCGFPTWFIVLLLSAFLAGCGGGGGGGSRVAPTVIATVPPATTPIVTGVAINSKVNASFSKDMAPATISTSTFTLACPAGTPVAGTVAYLAAGRVATFSPTANLPINTTCTATITTGIRDTTSIALANAFVWTFATGATADTTPPTVAPSNLNPPDLATGVCLQKRVIAIFSEDMQPSTITAANFTLQLTGPPLGSLLAGTVSYDVPSKIGTFTPTSDLAADSNYTATVSTGAEDVAGNALASNRIWTFTTGSQACPPPIALGLVAPVAIAANAGVTNTFTIPITTINGNVVLDPVAGATCNAVPIDAAGGFGLCGGSPPTINGTVISPLFPDAGATSGAIINDLQAAFLSITPPAGPPAAGSLGGATPIPAGTTLGEPTGSALVQGDNLFTAGVYQSLTSILITGDLTLDGQGDPNAVFIFQSSSTVGTAAGAASPAPRTRILLINGAKASNVWWQAGSSATLGLFSEFQGNILASADITMTTGATSCGRLLAGGFTAGAFVFDSNVVSVPGNVNAPPTCN